MLPSETDAATSPPDLQPKLLEDEWQLIAHSTVGASHRSTNLPNQDAWAVSSSVPLPRIAAAVADGHGDPKCRRSAIGARFAVDAALGLLDQLRPGDVAGFSTLRSTVRDILPRAVVRSWLELVDEHRRAHPIIHTEDDTQLASDEQIEPRAAYGTTLLCGLIDPEYVVCAQIGDGDIVVVTADGQIVRPFECDDRLLGNITTSLGGCDANRELRTRFWRVESAPPAMMLLSSDGLKNGLDEHYFDELPIDMMRELVRGSIEEFKQGLELLLSNTASQGSGDDVTLVVLYRPAAIVAALHAREQRRHVQAVDEASPEFLVEKRQPASPQPSSQPSSVAEATEKEDAIVP